MSYLNQSFAEYIDPGGNPHCRGHRTSQNSYQQMSRAFNGGSGFLAEELHRNDDVGGHFDTSEGAIFFDYDHHGDGHHADGSPLDAHVTETTHDLALEQYVGLHQRTASRNVGIEVLGRTLDLAESRSLKRESGHGDRDTAVSSANSRGWASDVVLTELAVANGERSTVELRPLGADSSDAGCVSATLIDVILADSGL